MLSFGSLLRSHRQQAQLSLSALGKQVNLDFSYLSRLERGKRSPPGRATILDLATVLELTRTETDILLVAAGQIPDALMKIGPLDASISQIASVLTNPAIPTADRERFRKIISLLSTQWSEHIPSRT